MADKAFKIKIRHYPKMNIFVDMTDQQDVRVCQGPPVKTKYMASFFPLVPGLTLTFICWEKKIFG